MSSTPLNRTMTTVITAPALARELRDAAGVDARVQLLPMSGGRTETLRWVAATPIGSSVNGRLLLSTFMDAAAIHVSVLVTLDGGGGSRRGAIRIARPNAYADLIARAHAVLQGGALLGLVPEQLSRIEEALAKLEADAP